MMLLRRCITANKGKGVTNKLLSPCTILALHARKYSERWKVFTIDELHIANSIF
jgi:hypothetical protein